MPSEKRALDKVFRTKLKMSRKPRTESKKKLSNILTTVGKQHEDLKVTVAISFVVIVKVNRGVGKISFSGVVVAEARQEEECQAILKCL